MEKSDNHFFIMAVNFFILLASIYKYIFINFNANQL